MRSGLRHPVVTLAPGVALPLSPDASQAAYDSAWQVLVDGEAALRDAIDLRELFSLSIPNAKARTQEVARAEKEAGVPLLAAALGGRHSLAFGFL